MLGSFAGSSSSRVRPPDSVRLGMSCAVQCDHGTVANRVHSRGEHCSIDGRRELRCRPPNDPTHCAMTAPATISEKTARWIVIGHDAWGVYEDARAEAPYYGPALIFHSGRIARRVRQYPDAWDELSDEQLYTLSWSR